MNLYEGTGQVARILDEHSLIINRGINHGVHIGQIVALTQAVIDPETGDHIGSYERLRLKIDDVFPTFCIAETYRLVYRTQDFITCVDIGDPVIWLDCDE